MVAEQFGMVWNCSSSLRVLLGSHCLQLLIKEYFCVESVDLKNQQLALPSDYKVQKTEFELLLFILCDNLQLSFVFIQFFNLQRNLKVSKTYPKKTKTWTILQILESLWNRIFINFSTHILCISLLPIYISVASVKEIFSKWIWTKKWL